MYPIINLCVPVQKIPVVFLGAQYMSMCQIYISASIYIFLSNICQGCQYLFMCSNIFILHIYTILDSAIEVCGVCLETKMA